MCLILKGCFLLVAEVLMAEALLLQSSSILGNAGMSRARGVPSPSSKTMHFTLGDVAQRGGVGKDLGMSYGK